jgi:glycerol-3-phosphate acyltransferase PlsY
VATTLGVLLVTAWPVGLGACLTWLAVAGLFRISSLAALAALALAPVYAVLFIAAPEHQALMAAGLAILGFVRHHTNIRRLLNGTEPRIGAKKA